MQMSSTDKAVRADRALACAIFCVALFRMWLLSSQYVMATYTPHDDYLFVLQAEHLLKGEWLGEFNSKTLIKGIGYPVFMALANLLSLAVLTAQQLLYTLACIVAVVALRPLVRRRGVLFLIFVFLLFNPLFYNYPLPGRLFRLGLSVPLVMLTFSCMLGLLLRLTRGGLTHIAWGCGLAVSFTWLWYTREEGIWLVPSVALFVVLYLVPWKISRSLRFLSRAGVLFLPVLFMTMVTITIGYANYKHYGVFMVNELKSREFVSAYGGLMNVVAGPNQRTFPVKNSQFEAAMRVSPALMELAPYYDHHHLRFFSFFIWQLRTLVHDAGYYDELPRTLDFYDRVGHQIKAACDSGQLVCLDRQPALSPPWFPEYNKLVIPVFWSLLQRAAHFSDFDLNFRDFFSWRSKNNPKHDIMPAYTAVLNDRILPPYGAEELATPEFAHKMRKEKVRILIGIGHVYKHIVVFGFILAVLGHVVLLLRAAFQKKGVLPACIGCIIIGGLLSLLAVLTFVEITLWPVARPLYAAYPLVLLYIPFIGSSLTGGFRRQENRLQL